MGLIDHLKEEDNYFIKISDAIDLIEEITNEPPCNISIYLNGYLFSCFVPMYKVNNFNQYYLDDSFVFEPNVIRTLVYKNTYQILMNLSHETDRKKAGGIRVPKELTGNYWLRHDFFNNDAIKALNIKDELEDCQIENIYLDERNSEIKRMELVRNMRNESDEDMIVNSKQGDHEKLSGLEKYNQSKQDAKGMARVIAKKYWSDDEGILIGDMANKVYANMVDYCQDFLPQEPDSIREWIKPVAPEAASRRGRPKKTS